MNPDLRILIVCDNASVMFGGEAILPLHYFRNLREHDCEVWLVTHARNRAELATEFPGEARIHFVEDSGLHRLMWHVGRRLPAKVADITTGFVSRLAAQIAQRSIVRRLVASEGIDVVHQPTPVSPREPSLMHGVGAPVVIGPMNGGMDYPPAFRHYSSVTEKALRLIGRWSSGLLNALLPGKRRASLLLVANERSRLSLPPGLGRQVEKVSENGVDLALWTPRPRRAAPLEPPVCTFAFMGRLIRLKAVDVLLEAFAQASACSPMRLVIMGEGEERMRLEGLARSLLSAAPRGKEAASVRFTGWLSQAACAEELERVDCLVMPSLHDCGGSVVLEAMSMSKPVIATAWGGPLDYLDPSCAILVKPASRRRLVGGLAEAMVRLAGAPAERADKGRAGRARIEAQYDWRLKAERMVSVYRRTLAAAAAP